MRLESELVGLTEDDALFRELAPRLHELRENIASSWLAEVGGTRIANCLVTVCECPKRWNRLTPTHDLKNRFCSAWKRTVRFCETIDEARDYAGRGICIALDSALTGREHRWRFPAEAQRTSSPMDGEPIAPFETLGILMEIDDQPSSTRNPDTPASDHA